MSLITIYFIAHVFLISNVNPANILGLFPHPGKSHFMVYEPVLRKLAERGHNVTVASFFPTKDAPYSKEISFVGIVELTLGAYDLGALESESILYRIPRLGRVAKLMLQMEFYRTSALSICERLINFKPLLEILEGSYDIVVMEHFNTDCMSGLLHVFGIKAPVVNLLVTSRFPWTGQRVGMYDNPAYVPACFSSFTANMSLFDRVENTMLYFLLNRWYSGVQVEEKKIIQKKYGEIPDLHELAKKTALVFQNSYYVFSGVKPLSPGLIEVGGMHLPSEGKRLPRYLEKFLNESTHGVILFSLGSRVNTASMSKYKQEIFINVLSKLKQRVIWKFEGSDAEGTLVGNILKVKWLPQYHLLLHDKTIAFISHGGMLGQTEAMSAGKPAIVIPIFADQPTNAAAAAEAGVGVVLSYRDLTEELLDNAVQRVLSAEMREHCKYMSRAWRDRDTPPLDLAVTRIERLLLRPAPPLGARDLPAYQLALLDVAIAILAVLTGLMALSIYCILKVVKVFQQSDKQKLH